ncbi:MAG: hypothetical protein NVS3B12_33230 [Acidimicrobiales bacterium]
MARVGEDWPLAARANGLERRGVCADIALAPKMGFAATSPAQCALYATDALGDPVASVPVGA